MYFNASLGFYCGDNVMTFGMSLQYGDFYLRGVLTWLHSLPTYIHNSASEVKTNT
jgi:hypothetical protein